MKTSAEPAEYILQSPSSRSAVLRNSPPQVDILVAEQVHENVPFHNRPSCPFCWYRDGVLLGHLLLSTLLTSAPYQGAN